MSFSGLNSHGGVHPCYTFFERLNKCVRKEVLPSKMCTHEGEDYLECINKKK